tara:strand:- start:10 stop:342 length:333 start_codon:yes stop_codon:yes gene_type:complete
MRNLLMLLFAGIFVLMIALIVWAVNDRSLWEAGRGLAADPWFWLTLGDAYMGFVIIYVWICYKERGFIRRGLWLVLIMTLGNLAVSVYLLHQLWKLGPQGDMRRLLLRVE